MFKTFLRGVHARKTLTDNDALKPRIVLESDPVIFRLLQVTLDKSTGLRVEVDVSGPRVKNIPGERKSTVRIGFL